MHLFSPWKEEEEFTVVSTVLLMIGVFVVLLALGSAILSSAH